MTTTTRLRLVWSGARLGHAGRASDSIIGNCDAVCILPARLAGLRATQSGRDKTVRLRVPNHHRAGTHGLTPTLAATA